MRGNGSNMNGMNNINININNFRFDEKKIDECICNCFSKMENDPNVHNKIEQIHPQIAFKYNSLNVCVGKQGTGKTTFMLRELIKLSNLPNQPYDKIIYITNNENIDEGLDKMNTMDQTFVTLKQYITNIPIYGLSFEKATGDLQNFFQNRTDTIKHTFIIIEDASFLLLKDNPVWGSWVTKLRHYRMTIWMNLHIWRALNTQIRSQISCVFVFPGYSKEQLQLINRQTSPGVEWKVMYYLYTTLPDYMILKIDNIDSRVTTLQVRNFQNNQSNNFNF